MNRLQPAVVWSPLVTSRERENGGLINEEGRGGGYRTSSLMGCTPTGNLLVIV